jgi:cytochrome c oxidase assembly factor 2
MPPHLHPRSRMTSSLFATTVLASFFVVALPHILPCPAPRVAYADSSEDSPDGTRRRRRRRPTADGAEARDGLSRFDGIREPDDSDERVAYFRKLDGTPPRPQRECPVPKPGGVIGELMGFGKTSAAVDRGSRTRSEPNGDGDGT